MAQGNLGWRQARGTFVGLMLGWATLSGCRPTGRRALMEGDRQLQAGRVAEALPLLERAALDLQTDGTAWNHLGRAYHEGGKVVDARKAYLRALQADRNLFDAHYNLGQLALETGAWRDAEAGFRTWLGAAQTGAAPANVALAWRGLGLAQFQQGNVAEAERSLGTALRIDDKDAEAWNVVGLIRQQRRQYRDAFNTFVHAARLAPTYGAPRLNAAILAHQYLNDRRAALEYYRAYLALNPPDAAAVSQLVSQLEPRVGVVPAASTAITAAPSLALRSEATPTNTHTAVPAPASTTTEPPVRPTVAESTPPRSPAPVAPDTPPPAVARPVVSVPAPASAAAPAPAPVAPVASVPAPTVPTPIVVAASRPNPEASIAPVATPPVAVPAPLEVFQVAERPVIRPAAAPLATEPAPRASTPAPTPTSAETVPPVPSLPPASGPVATAPAEVADTRTEVAEAPKPSVWARANPVSWFKRDRSTTPDRPRADTKRVTPLEFPPVDVAPPAAAPAPTVARAPEPRSRREIPVAKAPPAPVAPTTSAPAPAVARVRPVFPRYSRQVAAAPSPGDRVLAQKELDPAVAAHRDKDWDRAVQGYQRAIALDPACFEAQYNLSVAAGELGNAALSLRAAETAVMLRPADPAARYQFAVALQRNRHLADAAVELEEVVRLQPDNASGHLAVATVQANDLDDPARARVHYERVLALEPTHPQAAAIRRWLASNPVR